MTTQSELAYQAEINGMSVPDYVAYIEENNARTLDRLPVIDVPALPPKRRLAQPVFKLSFDTREDLWARIGNTFIWVGPRLFCVEDIRDYKGDYWLILADGKGGRFKAPYKENNLIDLRSPDPQYLNLEYGASFVTRKPDRQFLQGMSRGNTYCKSVGSTEFCRMDNMWELIPGLENIDNLTWQTSFWELMAKTRALRTLRMSSCIAFYRSKDDKLVAEYRGRPIGYVTDDCVEMDERDYSKPWIRKDFHEIGCTTRKGQDAPAPQPSNH